MSHALLFLMAALFYQAATGLYIGAVLPGQVLILVFLVVAVDAARFIAWLNKDRQ